MPEPGDVLGGKYEIVRLLGEGGMALVFEASHKRLQQRVAIKILTPEFAADAELVARFEREARAVARLRTNHVVRVMDVDTTTNGIPYIVMEFLLGRDLDAELQARTRLPVDESVDIILQACAGMHEAHAIGIVHRDLKPANLFLAKERDGADRIVKVLDFGISKIVGEATRLTTAGTVMGTVLYMSPEQVRAEANVDTRADIWALGVILFEMLAGRAPWEGSSPQIATSIVRSDPPDLRNFAPVPEPVAKVVRNMLQRDRAKRLSSLREVISALAPYAQMGSIGSTVAALIAGEGSSRSRLGGVTATLPLMKSTLPLHRSPQLAERAAAAGQSFRNALQAPTAPPSAATVAPPREDQTQAKAPGKRLGRGPLVVLVVVAVVLLGAGSVLIRAAIRQRPSGESHVDAGASAHVSAVPTIGPAQPADAAEGSAGPPSTGTAPHPSSTSSSRVPVPSPHKDAPQPTR